MTAMGEWKTMESAPLEEIDVLLWRGDDRPPIVAAWYGPSGWLSYDAPRTSIEDATHWMPLPSPPNAGESAG